MTKSPFVRVTATLVALGIFAMLGQVAYALQEGKGNLTGTVLTADGKPAVGLNVKIVKDIPRDMRRPGSKGKSTGLDHTGGAEGLQAKGGPRTKVVAQATCDQNGKFSMNNIEAGSYRLEAGSKGQGWIYQDVGIEAGKTVEMNDLKLAKID